MPTSPLCHGRPYAAEPSLAVLRRIAENADPAALREFHNHRCLFRLGGDHPLTFVGFAMLLCYGDLARGVALSQTALQDIAYDDLVGRFTDHSRCDADVRRDRQERDCRKNFAAIVRAVDRSREKNAAADEMAVEAVTARICQHNVAMHAGFALLEAARKHNPGRSRYQTRVDGRSVTVWMQKWLTGRRRREWLDQHVAADSDSANDLCASLQRRADQEFGRDSIRSIADSELVADHRLVSPLEWLIEHEIATQGLVPFVADEKAVRHKELPKSIARLGPDRVRALVLRVFAAMDSEGISDRAIAAEFGLSPASYSRFAGRRWRPGGARGIPRLYDNLCQALAAYPPFTDLARKAGVWETVRQLLQRKANDSE